MLSEEADEVVAVGAYAYGITRTTGTFDVAVCDEVLDVTFDANSTVTQLSIAQKAAPQKRDKPAIFAIGDSTTSNTDNGGYSWGNCAAGGNVTLPDVFSNFYNHGMAGRDSVNFYNQGRVETVLLAVAPGDYVTVNMGINSKEAGEGAAFYTLLDEYYVNAIIQRGAIPVIVTATPQGPVGKFVGNYSNGTFNCNRGKDAHNGDLRKIAQKYDLNIIELGYWGDALFNAIDDADSIEAYNTAHGTNFDTTKENAFALVQSWYADHNHYKEPLAEQIAKYITESVAKIVDGNTDFNQAKDPHITEQ